MAKAKGGGAGMTETLDVPRQCRVYPLKPVLERELEGSEGGMR